MLLGGRARLGRRRPGFAQERLRFVLSYLLSPFSTTASSTDTQCVDFRSNTHKSTHTVPRAPYTQAVFSQT